MTTLLINKSTQEKWKLKNKKKNKTATKILHFIRRSSSNNNNNTQANPNKNQKQQQQQIQERKDRLFVSKNLNLYRFVAVSFAFSTEKVCSKKKVMWVCVFDFFLLILKQRPHKKINSYKIKFFFINFILYCCDAVCVLKIFYSLLHFSFVLLLLLLL